MSNITEILQNSVHPTDASLRRQADQQLQQLQQGNYAEFLHTLAKHMGDSSMAPDTRQIAGLVLKNTLASRDAVIREQLLNKWVEVDDQVKDVIHQLFLETLNDSNAEIAKTAALCIGKIGAVDIWQNKWTELYSILCQKAIQGETVGQKLAALDAIGYLFEELGDSFDAPQDQLNNVLTAIVGNMMGNVSDMQLRYSATRSLQYVLDLARVNFDQEVERTALMQVICEACTYTGDQQVQGAGFDCLIRIVQSYYEKLPQYINHIYKITFEAAQTAEESVALQAIELLCTLCEEEQEREIAIEEGENYQLFNLVKQSAQVLVGLLTQLLLKQEEGQEEDPHSWNVSLAAATCLALVAQLIQDQAVELTIGFIQSNIGDQDSWRNREAATVAFGAIMEGPSSTALMKVSQEALLFLLNAMTDSNPAVKSTTAWTVGRMFEFVHAQNTTEQQLVTTQLLPHIIKPLLASLADEPYIADKVCYAISQLALGFQGRAQSPLAPFYQDILQALFPVTERSVSDGANLHLAAYDALIGVVRSSSHETLAAVAQMVPTLLLKLQNSVEIQKASVGNTAVVEEQSIIQGSLCGVLQEIIMKMSETETSKTFLENQCDNIMAGLLSVLGSKNSIHEEAMLAVGAVCFYCGPKFIKYLEAVMVPYVLTGIKNHTEWQAASITINLFGDICNQVGSEVNKYCNDVMQILMFELQSAEVNRNLKSVILTALGSIAMGIGNDFVRFVQPVVSVLNGAIQLSVHEQSRNNDDFIDQNNELRSGILEAVSGMLQGLWKCNVNEMLSNFIPIVVDYIRVVETDREIDSKVVSNAVAVLGDIAMTVQNCGSYFKGTNERWISALLKKVESEQPSTAKWAREQITQAAQQSA